MLSKKKTKINQYCVCFKQTSKIKIKLYKQKYTYTLNKKYLAREFTKINIPKYNKFKKSAPERSVPLELQVHKSNLRFLFYI